MIKYLNFSVHTSFRKSCSYIVPRHTNVYILRQVDTTCSISCFYNRCVAHAEIENSAVSTVLNNPPPTLSPSPHTNLSFTSVKYCIFFQVFIISQTVSLWWFDYTFKSNDQHLAYTCITLRANVHEEANLWLAMSKVRCCICYFIQVFRPVTSWSNHILM